MHNLRHFYYQNKQKIWKIVLIIALILGIIYYMDRATLQKSKNNISASNNEIIYNNEPNNTYILEQSAISGSNVSKEEVNKINNTIIKFLQYCKNEEKEKAYDMLSVQCKENEYESLEKFEEKYRKFKFDKESVYEIQKWINNTYKITISKDLLLTGDINNNKKQVEYITLVNESGKEKLNVSSYIGSKELNKTVIQNNIKITVTNKRTYMDYEIYDFKIENLSNKTIKIDSLNKIGTMYIEGINGNRYNAFGNEIFEEELEIKTKNEFELSIKYANSYYSQTAITKVIFEDVILDYIAYKNSEDKQNFKDIVKIEIDL